jgi:hypothetical protein
VRLEPSFRKSGVACGDDRVEHEAGGGGRGGAGSAPGSW